MKADFKYSFSSSRLPAQIIRSPSLLVPSNNSSSVLQKQEKHTDCKTARQHGYK